MIIIEQKEIRIKLKNGTNHIVEINNIIEEKDEQDSSKKSINDINNQFCSLNKSKNIINAQVKERILQYNDIENCYVSSDKICNDQDFEQISANQPLNCTDNNYPATQNYKSISDLCLDNKNNEDIHNLHHDIIELVKEYTPQLLEIYKLQINSAKDFRGYSLIELIKKIVKDLISVVNIENDEDYCKSAVWKRICDFKSEFFNKKQLTVILQKQYSAGQIDIALKKLISEGLISFFRIEDNGKTSGRKKSPEYRVNNFGKLII